MKTEKGFYRNFFSIYIPEYIVIIYIISIVIISYVNFIYNIISY